MDEEQQKIIADQMKFLPNDVKTAIVSVDYKTKLQEITQRQKLLIDQAGKLEMETTLVMIGLEPLADFTQNVQKQLNISIIRAQDIVMDVNENIFKPIRDSLQKMDEDIINSKFVKEDQKKAETPTAKFTDTNDVNLNRDQILKEIEHPDTISGGGSVNLDTMVSQPVENIPVNIVSTKEIEIRPAQELETLPGQGVKDITKTPETNIFEAKMTSSTITPAQVINAKPEVKLPEVPVRSTEVKKRPYGGIDPYKEPVV